MTIASKTLRYDHGGVAFEAYVAWDEASDAARPVILVAATFMGRSGFEEDKARRLAGLGYVGIAIDLYGVDHWPSDADEARAAMAMLDADRALLKARLLAALAAARDAGAPADRSRVAGIGYCFGGKCMLDLARSGADIAGVVSFHGLYDPPPFANGAIRARILVLHGWEDPLAPPETVLGLARELTGAGADWQLHAYGHTVHGFTNPARAGMYSPVFDARSWRSMDNFLAELFD